MKKQQFDLTKFETLKTSNDTLEGGFSQTLSATGGRVAPIKLELNLARNCGTTNSGCNLVAGCGASA